MKEKLIETLSFRVPISLYAHLKTIAKAERRKLSEVASAFLERGLAAYRRDGQLFEPVTAAPAEDDQRGRTANESAD